MLVSNSIGFWPTNRCPGQISARKAVINLRLIQAGTPGTTMMSGDRVFGCSSGRPCLGGRQTTTVVQFHFVSDKRVSASVTSAGGRPSSIGDRSRQGRREPQHVPNGSPCCSSRRLCLGGRQTMTAVTIRSESSLLIVALHESDFGRRALICADPGWAPGTPTTAKHDYSIKLECRTWVWWPGAS